MAGTFDNTSLRYYVAQYRKDETIKKETILEDFVWFLEDESQEVTPKQIKQIKAYIDKFLNRDMEKVTQGEEEMLKNWIKASKDQV